MIKQNSIYCKIYFRSRPGNKDCTAELIVAGKSCVVVLEFIDFNYIAESGQYVQRRRKTNLGFEWHGKNSHFQFNQSYYCSLALAQHKLGCHLHSVFPDLENFSLWFDASAQLKTNTESVLSELRSIFCYSVILCTPTASRFHCNSYTLHEGVRPCWISAPG